MRNVIMTDSLGIIASLNLAYIYCSQKVGDIQTFKFVALTKSITYLKLTVYV